MSDSPNTISHEEYDRNFPAQPRDNVESSMRAFAYKNAEEIRRFEIGLYWTRSAYFWAFIGATMAGYGAVQTMTPSVSKSHLSVLAAAMGFVFSVAWYFANRGSKQWHENWENHVDLLEDSVAGPLHKTILRRPQPRGLEYVTRAITGPGCYSVSKINQIVSCFVILLWALITLEELHLNPKAEVDWFSARVVLFALFACLAMYFIGRTDQVNHHFCATKRTSEIGNATPSPADKS
jgi:hypothetical protein